MRNAVGDLCDPLEMGQRGKGHVSRPLQQSWGSRQREWIWKWGAWMNIRKPPACFPSRRVTWIPRGSYLLFLQHSWNCCYCTFAIDFVLSGKLFLCLWDEPATGRTQNLFHCTCQVYSLPLVSLLADAVGSRSWPSRLASLAQSSVYLSKQHSDRKVRGRSRIIPQLLLSRVTFTWPHPMMQFTASYMTVTTSFLYLPMPQNWR